MTRIWLSAQPSSNRAIIVNSNTNILYDVYVIHTIQYNIYCVLVSILFVWSGISLYWKSMFRIMMDEWMNGWMDGQLLTIDKCTLNKVFTLYNYILTYFILRLLSILICYH